MTSILCLAHYCEVHGPTPLMVTEGLPIPCSACYEGVYAIDGPESSSSTPTSTVQPGGASISEALRRLNLDSHRAAASSNYDQDEPPSRTAIRRRAPQNNPTSAVDTPPLSPRYPSESSSAGHGRRESNYRRTYDETATKRASPCENCAMTLPKRQGSSSQASSDTESENGPTLRTRAPYARAYGNSIAGNSSPPNSNSTASDDDEGEGEGAPRRPFRRRTATFTSTTSRSSTSSSSATIHGHTHYQYYTSTHEPVVPSSFSIVRASCIRTLSFETLPRALAASSSTNGNTPLSSPSTPNFVAGSHAAGAVASGGPIFFGDPSAGYTTAYIFRIPDLQARGHKRVYAFLALSTHRERLAMKTFTFISNAFRELVAWILALAEAEAERTNGAGDASPAHSMYGGGPMGMAAVHAQEQSGFSSADPSNTNTSGSGFLASGAMGGMSRRMGAGYGYGYGGSGSSTKPKGLPELVGLPDFFLELHQKFVQLLLELGLVLRA